MFNRPSEPKKKKPLRIPTSPREKMRFAENAYYFGYKTLAFKLMREVCIDVLEKPHGQTMEKGASPQAKKEGKRYGR